MKTRACSLRFKTLAASLGALLVLGANADAADSRCRNFFRGVGNVLLSPLTYTRQVAQDPKLLFMVPREPRDKFNHWVWLDPFSYPITLPPELFKMRHRPSVPVVIGVTLPPANWYAEWESKRKKTKMEAELPHLPGGEYLGRLLKNDVLDEDDARAAWLKHRQDLKAWLAHPEDPGQVLPRFKELRRLGVIRSDAELAQLSKLARETHDEVFCPGGNCEMGSADAAAKLESVWTRKLLQLPDSRNRSAGDMALLASLLRPLIPLRLPTQPREMTDLEMQAQVFGLLPDSRAELRVLAPLSENLPPDELLTLAWRQLWNSEAIAAKGRIWKDLLPPEARDKPLPDFARRVDLPEFSRQKPVFQGNEVESEIGLWRLAAKDLRFRDLSEAFAQGVFSEVETVRQLTARTRAITAWEKLHREGGGLTKQDACHWSTLREADSRTEGAEDASTAVGMSSDWRLLLAQGGKSATPPVACQVGAFEIQEAFFVSLGKSRPRMSPSPSGESEPLKAAFAERERKISELLQRCASAPNPCPSR